MTCQIVNGYRNGRLIPGADLHPIRRQIQG
jgi:hypothetical protein